MAEKITVFDVENLSKRYNDLCFKINNNFTFKILKEKKCKNINFVKEHINNFNRFKNNLTNVNYTIHVLNIMFKNDSTKNNENISLLYNETKDVLDDLNIYYNSFLENTIKINNFIL